MRRKLSLIMLTALLSLQLSACAGIPANKNAAGKVITPGNADKKLEISIIVLKDQSVQESDFFSSYRRRFEREYGINVNYITIDWRNKEDYYKKLAVMLNKKEGAELILYQWYDMNALVKEKAVVDLRGKVPNLEKVYDSLLEEEVYYVPVGMAYMGMALNKKVLEGLNIAEPDLDWTTQGYYTIRDKWLAEAERPFTREEFYYSLNKHLYSLQIFDGGNGKVRINTQEMKELIRNVRNDIFSGKYQLNKNYTYKNYYNLLFDEQSEENKEGWKYLLSDEYSDSSLRNIDKENFCNILVSENNDYMLKWDNVAVLPRFEDESPYRCDLSTWGFLVNRNGKELELAYEFINGLLSDEVQLRLLDNPTGVFCYYPVRKTVEGDIEGMEKKKQLNDGAIELREYALNKVKSGEFSMDFYINENEREMFASVLKDISKYIFADRKYSDEELSKELKGLEDKYNIWLNE